MRVDHHTLEVLHAQARRERAQAVYRLLIAPVLRLFTKPAAPRHHQPALRSRLA
jgi:hypothetical protein